MGINGLFPFLHGGRTEKKDGKEVIKNLRKSYHDAMSSRILSILPLAKRFPHFSTSSSPFRVLSCSYSLDSSLYLASGEERRLEDIHKLKSKSTDFMHIYRLGDGATPKRVGADVGDMAAAAAAATQHGSEQHEIET